MVNLKKGHFVGYLMLVAVVAGSLVYMNVPKASAGDAFDKSFSDGSDNDTVSELSKLDTISAARKIEAQFAQCTIALAKAIRIMEKLPLSSQIDILVALKPEFAQQIIVGMMEKGPLDIAMIVNILSGMMERGPLDIARAQVIFNSMMEKGPFDLVASVLVGMMEKGPLDIVKAGSLYGGYPGQLTVVQETAIANALIAKDFAGMIKPFYAAVKAINLARATGFKAIMEPLLPSQLIARVW